MSKFPVFSSLPVKSHFCVSLRNMGRGRGWLEAVQFVGARILYLFVLKNESITSYEP